MRAHLVEARGAYDDDDADCHDFNCNVATHPDVAAVELSVLRSPALRSLSAQQVGQRLQVAPAIASRAIMNLARSVAAPTPRIPIPGASLDQQLAQIGTPSKPTLSAAVGPSSAARRLHISVRRLTEEGFDALMRAVPAMEDLEADALRLIAGTDSTEGRSDAGAIDPLNPAVYIVEAGDFPSKIAAKLTGDQSRWPELVAANSPPKTKDPNTGNFKFLSAGEKLILPPSWVVGVPGLPPVPGIPPSIPATPPQALPPVPPGMQLKWAYIVQPGDFPSKIAQKITGDAGRWPELKTANPQKAVQGPGDPQPGNFKTLVAGEKLNLPDSWAQFIALIPPPGVVPAVPGGVPVPPGLPPPVPGVPPAPPGVPPGFPPVPGIPPVATPPGMPPGGVPIPVLVPPVPVPGLPGVTADAAVIAQTKALLAAWVSRKTDPPPAFPADYGTPTSGDLAQGPNLIVMDGRTVQCLQSYQVWENQHGGALRTDGVLDTTTYMSLTQRVGTMLAQPPGTTTKPAGKSSGAPLLLLGAAGLAISMFK